MVEDLLGKIDLKDNTTKIAVVGLAMLGLIKITRCAVGNTWSLMKYFVLPRKDLASRYGKGSWAVVTGASDGLGKQYCLELASQGFNIVLFGRD